MPKSPKRPDLMLTPRDGNILLSLHHARYLPIDCIEWLHFPQWRERYAKCQQAHAEGSEKPYKVCTQAYTRMQQLREAGYVGRLRRPAMLAVETFSREADAFFLTKQGAEVVSAVYGLEMHEIHYSEPRERSYLFLQHNGAVGRIYAALRCRFEEKPELHFTEWRSELDFQRDHDRFSVWTPQGDGGGKSQEEGLQPDGAFVIVREGRRSVFFVEVERDQPVKKWRDKVYAYEAYNGSPQVMARYGKLTFTMLGIALNEHHQGRLLEATGEALALLYSDPQRREEAQQRYYISHMGLVHPTTIGRGWGTLTNITTVERGGVVPHGVQIESREHVLIR